MKLKTVIFYFILCICISLHAQHKSETNTSKVGLVLSGGGAKGFAHIGVLKVIDSLGIKVDYIAGTSMGAVIGSLYASGYTANQLEALFNRQDFNMLINDKFPRASKPFNERRNDQRYIVSLPFDNFKIKLPSALSKGQNIYNLLAQLMQPVDHISDFNDLPIPFFCIATDIETGASIIMDKGRLVEAVTASAALPSLFQPVIINNQILMDGGITNNFPVEELRDKGMDIIIGVDVQDSLKDRESLTSGLDVLTQINNFRTINAMKAKVPLTDIYIKPDITNFSIISFDEGRDIIANGKAAARAKLGDLLALKQKQQSYIPNPPRSIKDSITLKTIGVINNKRYTRSYLLGKLKLRSNEKTTFKDLNSGIQSLMSTDNFDHFSYQLTPTNDGDNSYNFLGKVREPEARTFLKLGIHYDGLYESAALANLTKKRLLFNNDLASLDVILGDNSRYNFEYFIDKGFYISIGVNSRYNQFDNNVSPLLVLDDDSPLLPSLNKINITLQDQTNQVYLQTIFRKDFAMRLGAEHKHLKIKSENIIGNNQDDDFIFENTDYLSVFGNLLFDSYDNALFPKKGFYFNGDFHLYLAASGFNRRFNEFSIAKADVGYAFSPLDKLALKVEASSGFKIGDKSTTTLGFGLGGYANNLINNFYSFYGYDYLALSGDSFIKSCLTVDYEIFRKHHVLLAANYGNVDDDLFESTEWLDGPVYSGYMIGYSLETFLGPLEAKFTHSPETNESYWFFNLGYWF